MVQASFWQVARDLNSAMAATAPRLRRAPAEPLPLLAPRRCDPGPSSFLQFAQEPSSFLQFAQEPDLSPYILGLFALLLVPRMLQSTGAKATKSVVFSHRTALYWPAIFLLLVGLNHSSSSQTALLGFAFALQLLTDPGGWASLLAGLLIFDMFFGGGRAMTGVMQVLETVPFGLFRKPFDAGAPPTAFGMPLLAALAAFLYAVEAQPQPFPMPFSGSALLLGAVTLPYILSGLKVFFPNDASVAFWFVVMTLVLSFSWPDERAPRPPHQKCGT